MASHGVAQSSQSRTEEQKIQELDKIKKYRDLEDQLRTQVANRKFSSEAFQLTSKLLRLNPEYYTVWNVRRRALIAGLLSKAPNMRPEVEPLVSSAKGRAAADGGTGSPGRKANDTTTDMGRIQGADEIGAENDLHLIRSELGFTIPLLVESPKCYWIWNYRGWILQLAIERLNVSEARRIWEEELVLASRMLAKDQRNFHAWGYRRYVVGKLESPELAGKSMAEAEFKYTWEKIKSDLSNFSAWHSRSKIIPRLLDERGASDQERQAFFDEELRIIGEALNVGPEDQSLWNYHQFLVGNLTAVDRSVITPHFTKEERVSYLTKEIETILELLEDYTDIKWIYEALVEYTTALCRLECREPRSSEKEELRSWMSKLKLLDPMRRNRWRDQEEETGLI